MSGIVSISTNALPQVRRFEVSGGQPLAWHGALGDSPEDIKSSFALSTPDTSLGTADLVSPAITVSLNPGVSWAQVGVIVLVEVQTGAAVGLVALQKLRPGPLQVLQKQPTMFDNCLKLSDRHRLRWSLVQDAVEFGLEGRLPRASAIGFGPAAPAAFNRLMGGADVIVAGFDESAKPFALDTYITNYEVCNYGAPTGQLMGVCEDYSRANGDTSVSNVELLHSHMMDGISFVRVRRKLETGDARFDHPIKPTRMQAFIWAIVKLGDALPPRALGPAIEYHGPSKGFGFDELKALNLSRATFNCTLFSKQDTALSSVIESPARDFASRYDASVVFDQKVSVHWTLTATTLRLGVRTLQRSGWVSVGFGATMVGSRAYVGSAVPASDAGVRLYHLQSLYASGAKLLSAIDESVWRIEGNNVGFEVNIPLQSTQGKRVITVGDTTFDVDGEIELVWAVGDTWHATALEADNHYAHSRTAVRINFRSGAIGILGVDSKLVAHGLLMWIAWIMLLPAAVAALRYIRRDAASVKAGGRPLWLAAHMALVLAAFLCTLVALILSLVYDAEKGIHLVSAHAKVGVAVLVMLAVQLMTALARPPPMPKTLLRRLFELGHRVLAASTIALAIAAVFTGFSDIQMRGVDNTSAFVVSTIILLGAWALLGMYGEGMGRLCKVSASSPRASPPPDGPARFDVEEGPAKDALKKPFPAAWSVPLLLFAALTLGLAIWSGVAGRDSQTVLSTGAQVVAAGSPCSGSCVDTATFWIEFDVEISRFDAPVVEELRSEHKRALAHRRHRPPTHAADAGQL